MRKVLLFAAAATTAVLFCATPASVLAHDGDHPVIAEDTQSAQPQDKDKETVRHRDGDEGVKTEKRSTDLSVQRSDKGNERLSAAKLRVCQNREKTVKAIMARSLTRAERHLQLFGTIADRTKAFYQSKGNTLENYDQLVAAVDAAKAKAEASLASAKSSSTFSCDGNDPKGTAGTFKSALETLVQDLKAYRGAVKNLIVGVKSVQGEV